MRAWNRAKLLWGYMRRKSALNALPGVIPIIAPLLPAAAIGDIFMLTKNQAMMLYRLAAIHEQATGDDGKAAEHRRFGPAAQ